MNNQGEGRKTHALKTATSSDRKKKSKRGITKKLLIYNKQNMIDAVEAVRGGTMSMKQAAKTYEVPRTSLMRKVKGEVPLITKMGPATILSKEEENLLKNYILAMSRKGFPVHRENILDSVGKLMKETERESVFPNGRPGVSWFKAFLQRHPQISEKEAESLTKARAAVSEEGVRLWFAQVSNYFKEEGLEEVLKDAKRVFNADETGFMLCPKTGKLLCEKGHRHCYKQVQNNEKEQLTVMCAFSADGGIVPPTIVYPYKRKLPRTIADEVPDGWGTGISPSGWMNSEVFYGYIANFFIPYITEANIQLPVVLFVDGYKSHVTLQISELCAEHQIVLVAFHPNSTHFLQPADVSVFGPMKKNWKKVAREWQYENFPNAITRQTFAKVLKLALQVTAESIKNGFKTCGIFPFTADGINFDKLIKARHVQNVLSEDDGPTDELSRREETPKSPPKSKKKASEALATIEHYIDEDRLIQFEEVFASKNEWFEEEPTEKRATELYQVWRALKTDALNEEIIVSEATNDEMNICSNDADINSPVDVNNSSIISEDCDSIMISYNDPIIINVPTFNQSSRSDFDNFCQELPETLLDFQLLPPLTEGNPAEMSLLCEDPDLPIVNMVEPKELPVGKENSPLNNMPQTATKTLSSKSSGHKRKYASVSPFKKCLLWPKSPAKNEPAGPRRTRRKLFPAVVSSEKWKEHYQNEENKKVQKEIEKKNKKHSKKSKTEDDWVCKQCGASWRMENKEKLGLKWVNCDSCKSAYHFRCIPKKHRDTYGLESDSEDDNLAFECHLCAASEDELSD